MKIYKKELSTYGEQECGDLLVIYDDYDYIKPVLEIKEKQLGGFYRVYIAKTIEQAEAFINLYTNDYKSKRTCNKIQEIKACVYNNFCSWLTFVDNVISTDFNDKTILQEIKNKKSTQEIVNRYI